jgi:hypothetical protein
MDGEILARVIGAVRTAGGSAVVLFDLDSTLLDNRPRQARIYREYGAARGIGALAKASPEHWNGWDLREPLRKLGLSPAEIDSIYPDLRTYWRARFFTSEYCREDVPIHGAPTFVSAIAAAGAQVVYLTGRHEGMRAGTMDVLARHGFPVPPGRPAPVHLLMKPTLEESDDLFKAEAHARVQRLGRVVAAFDNEPLHANDLARSFPEATVVHLDTDHSGRQIALAPGIPSIPHFASGLT